MIFLRKCWAGEDFGVREDFHDICLGARGDFGVRENFNKDLKS